MAIKLQLACRLGSLHDLPAMKMLFAETIRATCNQDYNPTQVDVWIQSTKKDDRWSSIVLDQYLIIAEISTQIVGLCSS